MHSTNKGLSVSFGLSRIHSRALYKTAKHHQTVFASFKSCL